MPCGQVFQCRSIKLRHLFGRNNNIMGGVLTVGAKLFHQGNDILGEMLHANDLWPQQESWDAHSTQIKILERENFKAQQPNIQKTLSQAQPTHANAKQCRMQRCQHSRLRHFKYGKAIVKQREAAAPTWRERESICPWDVWPDGKGWQRALILERY